MFNGQLTDTTGAYYNPLFSSKGCDSLIILNLTVLPVITTNLYDTICQGTSYSFNSHSLNVTGVYLDALTGTGGCDSIIILNLQVKSSPPPVINASAATAICPGGSVTLDAGPGYTAYLWNYQSNTSETLDVTQAGSYYCVVTSAGCQVSSDTVSVIVNPITVGFTSITNDNDISFTNVSTNATSYLWNFGDGDTSATQSPSHTYVTSGSYSVILTVSNNSCTLADTQSVTTGCQEAQLTTGISGPATVCAGSMQIYTTQGNSYTSQFTWILSGNCAILSGQGTNTIAVQFMDNFNDGVLRVYAKGCLGYGTERSIILTNGVTPPGAIAGPVGGVCGGSTQTYSVGAINGTTSYNWSITGAQLLSGQGTDSITVFFPQSYDTGTISIQTQSTCGVSSPVKVQVISALNVGDLLGGNTGYCAGSTGVVLTILPVPGATFYSWQVPSGIDIIGGSSTNAIIVDIDPAFTQGTVLLYVSNGCGDTRVKEFLISGNPEKPAKVIGPPLACSDVEVTDSVKPVPFAISYTWTVPSDWVINGPSNTNRVSYTPVQGSGTVSVTTNNECGSSSALVAQVGVLFCDKVEEVNDSARALNTSAMATNGVLSQMKVFPNPFNDQFEVVFDAPASMNLQLKVYTIQGQLLRELRQETVSGTNNIYIDLGDEASGIYILSAAFGDETRVLRMVKE